MTTQKNRGGDVSKRKIAGGFMWEYAGDDNG